ncbi:MAG: beta-ketoacyl synthase N-terminal-like domain-containing protein [Agriterribacter sp.]
MYIRATASISPQQSFEQLSAQPAAIQGNRMNCAEPDYTTYVDPKMIRRMSRIIKMGVAAASQCLRECNVTMPDAIITGTAYGCLADTEVFLSRMIEHDETLLTPTAFIQSTHNTVGAQIALLLKCHNYNNTFVHRGFSFESALLDTITLLNEQQLGTALVGGVDEITNTSHTLLSRFNLYKKTPVTPESLFEQNEKGTIAGEGAAFFLLSPQASGNDYAQLKGLYTFYKPSSGAEIENHIQSFLKEQQVNVGDVDLVITGENGDSKNDAVYKNVFASIFSEKPSLRFKHLCGEYPTAAAFALWYTANILKTGKVPANSGLSSNPRYILLYNHHNNIHHSLYLLCSC